VIIDMCPYWTNPTTGGGPERVKHLCEALTNLDRVTELSLRPTLTLSKGGRSLLSWHHENVTENYQEIQIPHVIAMTTSVCMSRMGLPDDLLMSKSCAIYSPRMMRKEIRAASKIQVEHPWLMQYVRKDCSKDAKVVLSTHNCETRLMLSRLNEKKSTFQSNSLEIIRETERKSIELADCILAVSDDDSKDFVEILGEESGRKAHIVPNGVDCKLSAPVSEDEKERARSSLGIDSRKVAVFMGSRHHPNIEAVHEILRFAPAIENELFFLVIGSVGEGFSNTRNVRFTGHVDKPRDYLAAADVALNPLLSGSGTSLKVLEYLASGIPLISTAIGIRGLQLKNGTHVKIAEMPDFHEAILAVISDHDFARRLAASGRKIVEEEYDWKVIGRKLQKAYKDEGIAT
jgi:glycosyltransferase involved in cell wall biosynthesis